LVMRKTVKVVKFSVIMHVKTSFGAVILVSAFFLPSGRMKTIFFGHDLLCLFLMCSVVVHPKMVMRLCSMTHFPSFASY
jgi:hypothetical protein